MVGLGRNGAKGESGHALADGSLGRDNGLRPDREQIRRRAIDQACDDDRSSCSSAPRLPSWGPRSPWPIRRRTGPAVQGARRDAGRAGRPVARGQPRRRLAEHPRPPSLGTDWRSGSGEPAERRYSTGSIVGDHGRDDLGADRSMPRAHAPGGDLSGGSPDVVWGPGNKVYAVEVRARHERTDRTRARPEAGHLPVRLDRRRRDLGHAELELALNDAAGQAISDPSIAYDAVDRPDLRRVHEDRPVQRGSPAIGTSTSQVRLSRSPATTGPGGTPITPVGDPAASSRRHPSIAVLPNGTSASPTTTRRQNPGSVRRHDLRPAATGRHPRHPLGARHDRRRRRRARPASPARARVVADVRPRSPPTRRAGSSSRGPKQTDAGNMDVFTATSRDCGRDLRRAAGRCPPTAARPTRSTRRSRSPRRPRGRRVPRLALRPQRATGRGVGLEPPGRTAARSRRWSPSVPVESAPIIPVAPHVPGGTDLGDADRRSPRSRDASGPDVDARRLDRHAQRQRRHAAERGRVLDGAPARDDGTVGVGHRPSPSSGTCRRPSPSSARPMRTRIR